MTKLIVGCGYLGGRVARLWRAEGHAVVVGPAAIAPNSNETLTPNPSPGTDRRLVGERENMPCWPMSRGRKRWPPCRRPKRFSTPSATIPAAATRRPGTVRRGRRPAQNVLDALPPGTGRIIFISSTGVYGDAGGRQWVDEESPCNAAAIAGRALLAAEEVLHRHPLGAHRGSFCGWPALRPGTIAVAGRARIGRR